MLTASLYFKAATRDKIERESGNTSVMWPTTELVLPAKIYRTGPELWLDESLAEGWTFCCTTVQQNDIRKKWSGL